MGDYKSRALADETILHGRYVIRGILGVGGFGITYLGSDLTDDKSCAIKEYFPSDWAVRPEGTLLIVVNDDPQVKKAYEHGRDIFINEARILKGLSDEGSVANVSDYFEENRTAYIVMEYIKGDTISNIIKKNGVLPLDRALNMLVEIGGALGRIHKMMLLHRDISPDNIMLDESGRYKLIDFGSTRAYTPDHDVTMSVMVKHGFAPIEQYLRNGTQGPWSDVYALAATFYYVVSGKKPPAAPDREMDDDVIAIGQLVEGMPAGVEHAIMKALSRSYKDRPQTMEEFIQELDTNDNWVSRLITSSYREIGNRKYQQDEIYVDGPEYIYDTGPDRLFAAVCDGMGGMTDGGRASEIASRMMREGFERIKDNAGADIPSFFRSVIFDTDDEISQIPSENGRGSGTTLVAVLVEKDKFWWCSAGDSRIYLLRDGRLIQLTRDHNYDMILKERIARGEMGEDEYFLETQKEALISFLGIGDIKLFDITEEPINLKDDEQILLCSDGLFKTLTEDRIAQMMLENEEGAAKTLVKTAIEENPYTQDNTSAIVIKYKKG